MTDSDMSEAELLELEKWARELYERRYGEDHPLCPICSLRNLFDGREVPSESMRYRMGNIHKEPKAWGQNWTCPECGFFVTFRVPLTADEWSKTREKMGGKHTPRVSQDALDSDITERLESLGYLEM